MKVLWTEDAAIIQKEIDSLVENKIELICGRRGSANITKLPVVGKTITKNGPVLVLLHPHEPTCSSEKCVFYYNSKGNPLRVFECKRSKKAENFVGFEFPKQIFNIHRRKFERITTPDTSVANFSFINKQRIHHGTIGDISIEGARLLVEIPGVIDKGTIICHITLTVCYQLSEIQTILIISEAEIIWSKCDNDITHTMGIKFTLSEKDCDALSNYIDLHSIEEAYKTH